jgi:hypothetical protein
MEFEGWGCSAGHRQEVGWMLAHLERRKKGTGVATVTGGGRRWCGAVAAGAGVVTGGGGARGVCVGREP